MQKVEVGYADEYLDNSDDKNVLTALMKDLIEYNAAPRSKRKIDNGSWKEETALDVREHNMDLIEQMTERWNRVQGAMNNAD